MWLRTPTVSSILDQLSDPTLDNTALQNNNTQIVADQKIEASNTYQGDINKALEGQASQNIAAINQGRGIAASSSRQGAASSFPEFAAPPVCKGEPTS